MANSPTSRTLDLLRKEGWQAQVVERYNPHSLTRLDLFGGIDVLACMARETIPEGPLQSGRETITETILGVQACSATDHARRKSKLLSEKKMAIWLASGGRLAIWSWSKKGARGARKLWTVRREELRLADFIPERAP